MFRLRNQLPHHRLNNAHIAVQEPANRSPSHGKPYIRGKPHHDQAHHGPQTSCEQDGLPANSIGEAAPEHARQGLGEGEGGDEEAGVEGGIFLVADLELLDQWPGIGEDGCEGDGLGEADNGWNVWSVM